MIMKTIAIKYLRCSVALVTRWTLNKFKENFKKRMLLKKYFYV